MLARAQVCVCVPLRVCLSINVCLAFFFFFWFSFVLLSLLSFAHRIAPWVININIDTGDKKKDCFSKSFPSALQQARQRAANTLANPPHLSAESCLFRWWHYLGQLTWLKQVCFQIVHNNQVVPRWAGGRRVVSKGSEGRIPLTPWPHVVRVRWSSGGACSRL